MKIIFLDFDGVLCTGRQAIASNERGVIAGLDPVALSFLNRICRENKLSVVISSTWRLGGNAREFYQLFAETGNIDLAKALHENWCTENISIVGRGNEIEKWLSDNECDGYVILDDDTDFLDYQKPFFVNTDSMNGMLAEHYIKTMEILGIND